MDLETEEQHRLRLISASSLYVNVAEDKVPLLYSPAYNIAFLGLEKLHPFDSSKWGHIYNILVRQGVLDSDKVVEPAEATSNDLLVVHTLKYLQSLNWSVNVANIIEVPPVALLPNFIIQNRVLRPFRKQVGGTILAGKLAMEKGWAINLGGGFHHSCSAMGGGFCVYADISLCIKFAFARFPLARVMIVDLDAHQGNGHERDFSMDNRVYIFDMYNRDIYPQDFEASRRINMRVELRSGTSTEEYIGLLKKQLEVSMSSYEPDLIIYNAGTDILEGDPLGRLLVSEEGVKQRDEIVFGFARARGVPILMLTSGGYMKKSAAVIAESIINLNSKDLIQLKRS